MAFVNPISYSSQASSIDSTSGNGGNNMGKDQFLQLLLAQLENQDPLNPMDSTDMTAQLAQFSQLEQLANINTSLEYSKLYLASLNNAQAVDFIGKEIEARGDSVQLSEGNSARLSYELNSAAGSSTINIYDQNMHLVRKVELGSQPAGAHEWMWDGRDNEGNQVAAGTYTFEVSATDVDGEEVAVNTYFRGVVTGVTFEDGITYLLLGEQKVAIGDVITVNDQEVVAVNEPEGKTEKALEIMKGIGQFMKNAAPIAMMFI